MGPYNKAVYQTTNAADLTDLTQTTPETVRESGPPVLKVGSGSRES